MNKTIEERKQEFARQLSIESVYSYGDMFSVVDLLYMDGKFEEAIKRYNSDNANFYKWVNAVLLSIHLRLNV